jgi:hypothetical protein
MDLPLGLTCTGHSSAEQGMRAYDYSTTIEIHLIVTSTQTRNPEGAFFSPVHPQFLPHAQDREYHKAHMGGQNRGSA